MKKVFPIIIAAAFIAILAGCSSGGAGGGSSDAEEAASTFDEVFAPLDSVIDFENVDGNSALPAGVTAESDETGAVTIRFANYSVDGYTYNGYITVSIEISEDFSVNMETGEGTGTMTINMSGSLTITGAASHAISFDYSIVSDMSTEEVSYSGSITVDGQTYDYEDLIDYMDDEE